MRAAHNYSCIVHSTVRNGLLVTDAGVAADERLYITGGTGGGVTTDSIDVYDGTTIRHIIGTTE